jgi:tRNA A-37 threonylcarbamoyl transferase component Bud32
VRDGIDVTFETKKNYNISGLGELQNYLAYMGTGMPDVTFKGVFMWDTGFMLMLVKGGSCLHLAKALWVSDGSKSLFVGFLTSDPHIPAWRRALNDMCASRSLRLVEHGFLGRGSRGRVFTVCAEGDVAKRALKVVTTEANAEELEKEVSTIKAYSNTEKYGALPVVSLCSSKNEDFFVEEIEPQAGVPPMKAAGYLMSTVGEPAPWKTLEEKRRIFTSLCQFHKQSIIHGDPRHQNVILSGEELVWIDFMDSVVVVAPISIRQDATQLLRSLYSLQKNVSLPVSQESLVAYGNNPQEDHAMTLLDEMEEYMRRLQI